MTAAETNHFVEARRAYKLGKYAEAFTEIDRLGPESQADREVLELRWALHADQGDWARCVDIARTLTLRHPDNAPGWLALADSIKNVPGGTLQMSYEILASAVRRLPDPILLLTLARYSAQIGRIEEMRVWIDKAHQAAGEGSVLNFDVPA